MTTPLDRYRDLTPEPDDPALARLTGDLDRALQALPAPPHLPAALNRLLRQRMSATPPALGVLSRKEALKAGAVAAGAAWLLTLGHTNAASADEITRVAREGPMSAARLVDVLRAERAQWEVLLARVGVVRMDEPGVEGTWSVKQIVTHLTWYEGVIVDGARQLMATGTFERSGLRAMDMDERNALLAEQSRMRPVWEVLVESEQVFEQLLAVVAATPDDILNDPRRLGLPDDVMPWMLVANNSYAHYQEHAEAIRAWLT